MPKIPYTKRSDGRYYKQIVIGTDPITGKRKVKTLYDKDWRSLDKKVREFMLDIDAGRYVITDVTFGECVELWWKIKENCASSTKYLYKRRLKKLLPLYSIKLNDLKPQTITFLLDNYKSEKKYAPFQLHALISDILNFAESKHLIGRNIIKEVDKPKIKPPQPKKLTAEEKNAIEQFIANSKNLKDLEIKTMLAILYYTGIRRGELLSLKRENIDFDNNRIHVKNTICISEEGRTIEKETTKTKAGVRVIPIIPQLKAILEEYVSNRKLDDNRRLLFENKRTKNILSYSNFEYRWKKIKKRINEYLPSGENTNITAHYLRHNYATELVYSGIPLKTVQTIMGHEKIQTTLDIYTNTLVDEDDFVDKLTQRMMSVKNQSDITLN